MAKPKKVTTETSSTLPATKRNVTGKKVKQLRKQGIIPANIFGPQFTSVSISIQAKDFQQAFKVAHETGIVYIALGNDSIPTLIRSRQRHSVTHEILHVDFRKIDLKQKIETQVPVEITGDSIAITQHGGVLLKQHDHLTVEALPQNIPAHIAIDISKITELGQEIKVSDITKSGDFEIKNQPETVIVSVIAHKEESVTPETTVAEPEVITEKPAEGVEGAPAEGATPAKESAAVKASPSVKAIGDKPADKEKKPSKEEKKKE